MSNQQVTPFEAARQPETLNSLLQKDAYRKRFEQVLIDRAPQFISSILSIGATMPDVEPRSILASAIIAASLNLSIDKTLGQAWIIPFRKGDRKLAQFIIGSRGITQLALRSAAYERMNAKPVNVEALNGYDSVGEPVIDWNKLDETKEPIGYVFAFKLTNGFTKTCYWSKAKVEAHAKRYSQAYRAGYETPWKTHFTEMAIKTIVANELRHWGILSIEMQKGFSEDQGMHTDIDTEVEFPEAADDISRPKFEQKEEAKELAAAGLAPAEPPVEPPPAKRKRAAKPTVPGPGSDLPAEGAPPATPTAPAPSMSAVPPAGTNPFGALVSEPYNRLKENMEASGITEAEVMALCKRHGLMTEDQVELLQLSDAKLKDLVERWPAVAGQIRIDRRAAK